MIIWTYAQIHCLHMYTYICIHMPDVGIHRWRAKQQTIHSMAAARGARWRRWIAGRLANISVICPRPDVLPAMVSTEPHPEHWVLHSTSFFWGPRISQSIKKDRAQTYLQNCESAHATQVSYVTSMVVGHQCHLEWRFLSCSHFGIIPKQMRVAQFQDLRWSRPENWMESWWEDTLNFKQIPPVEVPWRCWAVGPACSFFVYVRWSAQMDSEIFNYSDMIISVWLNKGTLLFFSSTAICGPLQICRWCSLHHNMS